MPGLAFHGCGTCFLNCCCNLFLLIAISATFLNLKKNYIKGFDSMRAISIIMVLLTHLGLYKSFSGSEFLTKRVWPLISGLTGVQIFFALSGFLITGILLREFIKHGRINLLQFYYKRFLRLVPPLLIFFGIVILAMLLGYIPVNKHGLVYAGLYIYNFIPLKYYTGELGHMWSLAVEEQFYLLLPFMILVFKTFSKVLAAILLFLLLCLIAYFFIQSTDTKTPGLLSYLQTNYKPERWFIPAVAPIMCGSLLSLLVHFKMEATERIFSGKVTMLVISGLLFLAPLYLPDFILISYVVVQAFGISLFITWVYYNQDSKITGVLNSRVLNYIGKISYGLYVYQGFFLLTGPWGRLGVQQFPVNIILTFFIALFSYEYFEKYVLQFKDKLVSNG